MICRWAGESTATLWGNSPGRDPGLPARSAVSRALLRSGKRPPIDRSCRLSAMFYSISGQMLRIQIPPSRPEGTWAAVVLL